MAHITLTLEEYQDLLDRIDRLEEEVFKDEDENTGTEDEEDF